MQTGKIQGLFALLLVGLVPLGCEVTSEKIAVWKQNDRSVAKLRYAVRDEGQTLAIRAEAAAALAEKGWAVPLADDLRAIKDSDRQHITRELAKSLVEKMQGDNPKATSQVQLDAKDALFSIRSMLRPDLREEVDKALVGWLVMDYQQRDQGNHSVEKIVETVGKVAGRTLAEAITRPDAPIADIAKQLSRVGTQEDRDAAARSLAEAARKADAHSLDVIAALGHVGSPEAVKYLEELARGQGIKPQGEDVDARAASTLQWRTYATRALGLSARVEALDTLKAIAGDDSLKDDQALLRAAAFESLERYSSPKALDIILTFLNDADEKVRYRAVEAALTGHGRAALPKLLESLPTEYDYAKGDLEDLVEADIIRLGAEAAPALRKGLKSESWVARLVSARLLGVVGNRGDIALLRDVASDKTKIKGKGWDSAATVGSEAKTSIAALKKRFSR